MRETNENFSQIYCHIKINYLCLCSTVILKISLFHIFKNNKKNLMWKYCHIIVLT